MRGAHTSQQSGGQQQQNSVGIENADAGDVLLYSNRQRQFYFFRDGHRVVSSRPVVVDVMSASGKFYKNGGKMRRSWPFAMYKSSRKSPGERKENGSRKNIQ